MEALKEKIVNEGSAIGTEIVKVDMFLNHCMDMRFVEKIGEEFSKRFDGTKVDKILTVESSGIAIASIAARYFNYPNVVFAKKATPNTMNEETYSADAKSFTKGNVRKIIVSKQYLQKGENILILDDFLASGEASVALANIVEQAGGSVAGIGIVIEKGFQGGRDRLKKLGYKLESLAIIEKIEDGHITFR